MKAIILAAGRGTRLGDLTRNRPKCLVELGGRSLLSWQVQALEDAGLQPIGVVTGYSGESLASLGMTIFTNERWHETNMVASLLCASPWLDSDTCLISYADIVYPASTVQAIVQAPGSLVVPYNTQWLPLWQARFVDPLQDVETFRIDPQGTLLEIGRRAQSLKEIQGQYMGLLKISPPAWHSIQHHLRDLTSNQIDGLDMTGLLQFLIEAGMEISSLPVSGSWLEVDSSEDIELYEDWLKNPLKKGLEWMAS